MLQVIFYVSTLLNFSAAHAADYESYFTALECEAHLRAGRPSSGEAASRGRDAMTWITGQHQTIETLLKATAFQHDMHSLLYLTSGYLIPPTPSLFVRFVGRQNDYFTDDLSYAADGKYDQITVKRKRALAGKARLDRPGSATSLEYSSLLLARSFEGLRALIRNRTQVPDRVSFELHYSRSVTNFREGIALSIAMASPAENLEPLERVIESLNDDDVRRWLSNMVARKLPEIIAHHEDIHRTLAQVTQREVLLSHYRDWNLAWAAKNVTARDEFARTPARALAPPKNYRAIAAAIVPEDLLRESVAPIASREFLDRKFEVTAVAEFPFHEVHKDLRAAATWVSVHLARLRENPLPTVDWATWATEIDARTSWFDEFARARHDREAELDRRFERHGQIASEVGDVQTWLARLGSILEALELSEGATALRALPPYRQAMITSVLDVFAQTVRLTDQATLSIGQGGERVVKELDALAKIGVLAAIYLSQDPHHTNVESSASSVQLTILREAIAAMAERSP